MTTSFSSLNTKEMGRITRNPTYDVEHSSHTLDKNASVQAQLLP